MQSLLVLAIGLFIGSAAHHYYLLQTSMQSLRNIYRARLHFTSPWPLHMQGWAFEIKGWWRLRHLWLLSYIFSTHSFTNLSFQCFIFTSVFSLCFVFWSDCTTPQLVLRQLVSFLFAGSMTSSSISSLHLHVYSLVQWSYVFLVPSLTQAAKLILESYLPSKLEPRQHPILVS